MKIAKCLMVLSCLCMVFACSDNPKRRIIGEWEGTGDNKVSIEFGKDGSYAIKPDKGKDIEGKYVWFDERRMVIEVGKDEDADGEIVEVYVFKDDLILDGRHFERED